MDDALLDGWDAFLAGNGFDDRVSMRDQEAIRMLHRQAWTPAPRSSFTRELRGRLTAATPLSAPQPSTRRAPAASAGQPLPAISDPPSLRRWANQPTWGRVAVAAALIAALIAAFGGGLLDDPRPPTVRAPLAQVTIASPVPEASPGYRGGSCRPHDTGGISVVGSTFVDPMMTEVTAAVPSVRHATLQTLTRLDAGPVIPDGYDLSGVSGIVVDLVVLGAAEATFREGAYATTVDSTRFIGSHEVTPSMPLDLLRGDVVVYPVGALVELSNALPGRSLKVARLVLHDVEELPSRVTDSITIETVGRAAVDVTRLTGSLHGFGVRVEYAVDLPSPDVPGASCLPPTSVVVSGIVEQDPIPGGPDTRRSYGGPFASLVPLPLALPADLLATPPAPST